MMSTFRQWLLLRENFDPAAYDHLFNQELDALLPRLRDPVERERLASLRERGWTNYIAACLRNAGFRKQGDLEERIHDVVVKLLVSPGGLFRDYDERRHGPLDLRCKRSVANAVKNIVEKERNRQRYLRPVPLHTDFVPGGVRAEDLPARPEANHDETVIANFKRLLRTRLGDVAVAIFNARMNGEQTKSIIGLPALGSPGKHLVKRIVQQIKALARDYAEASGDPAFLRSVERLLDAEAETIQRRAATTRQRHGEARTP